MSCLRRIFVLPPLQPQIPAPQVSNFGAATQVADANAQALNQPNNFVEQSSANPPASIQDGFHNGQAIEEIVVTPPAFDDCNGCVNQSFIIESIVGTGALAVNTLRLGVAALSSRLFSASTGLQAVKSAQGKIDDLAVKFGSTSDDIVQQGLKGKKFRDADNNGNINIFSNRPDGKDGFLRLTLDPSANRIISAGLNRTRDVNRGIERGRFTPLD